MILSKWFLSWTCKGSISCEGMLIIPIVYIDNAYQCVHSMDRLMPDADRLTHFMCIHFTFHKIPIQFIVKEIKLHVIDYCINLEVRFEFVLYYYEYMKYWSKSDIHVFDTIRFIPSTILSEELSFVQLRWLIESIPIATCIYLHSLSIFPLFCKKID